METNKKTLMKPLYSKHNESSNNYHQNKITDVMHLLHRHIIKLSLTEYLKYVALLYRRQEHRHHVVLF